MQGKIRLQLANFITKQLQPGEFQVGDRIIKRSESSLFCNITNKNKCRRKVVSLIESEWFDRFIMLCIGLNSVTMAFFDYAAENKCKKVHCTVQCPFEFEG
jgi:hypothetical protein